MKAGSSSVTWTARKPLAAGSRWRSRIRNGPAPSAAQLLRTPCCARRPRPPGHPARDRASPPAPGLPSSSRRPRGVEDERHRGAKNDHDIDDREDEDEVGHPHQQRRRATRPRSRRRRRRARPEGAAPTAASDRDAKRQPGAKDDPREDVAAERVRRRAAARARRIRPSSTSAPDENHSSGTGSLRSSPNRCSSRSTSLSG